MKSTNLKQVVLVSAAKLQTRMVSTCRIVLLPATVLLFLLLLSMGNVNAQTPQYFITGGTSANSWPLNATSTGSNKVQWLYYPSNFATAPPGMITKVYFKANVTGARTITDMTIKLGYTNITAFPNGTFLTGLTTVYNVPTTNLTIPSNGWMGVTLATPFWYSGTQNLVVELSHNGTSGTGITVLQNNSTPNGRIYGNVNSATGTANSGLSDFGFDLLPGPPCATPGAILASGITSTAATLSWGAATPSVGYDYLISTNATPPFSGFNTTTGTSVNATGLTPATTYYLHVRNNCTNSNWSQWVTYQFSTNPPCTQRGILINNITTSSADIKWNSEPHASHYEYVLKENSTVPSSGSATPDSVLNATGLNEGTKYYFFVRMNCPGGETSDWALDSFTTRIICRPPALNVDHIESDRGIVYWNQVPSAWAYEYEISKSPTPLGEGTTIKGRSFYAFPLVDGQAYYFHVRSKCNDQGFASESDWATTAFSTFPTSVANTGNKDFSIAVFPNPLKDLVTISIAGKTIADAHITVTDLNGRTVHSSKISTNKTNIDLSNLAPGIYMMRYADQDYSEIIKLTKQ